MTCLWLECRDYVNQLSIMNKLDYVKLHGYEFHLSTRVIDKSLPKLCALLYLHRKP